MHVINVDIQDNHEEATLGAFLICELCQCVSIAPAPARRTGPDGTDPQCCSHSEYFHMLKPK